MLYSIGSQANETAPPSIRTTMRTHQRLIATAAMAVGAALLSPTAVCAEGGVRAAAPSDLLEFGGAAVPEDTASVVALRAPADADAADMEEVAGGRRLMWWNWVANLGTWKTSEEHPMVAIVIVLSFRVVVGIPLRIRVVARRPGPFL